MPEGAGKYDDMATYVRRHTRARGVLVAVLGGRLGPGFSVQGDMTFVQDLPRLLRSIADDIDRTWTQQQQGSPDDGA